MDNIRTLGNYSSRLFGHFSICLVLTQVVLTTVSSNPVKDEAENQVLIEDFIDLDEPPSHAFAPSDNHVVKGVHGAMLSHNGHVIVDDEDFFSSGSGSGSGDSQTDDVTLHIVYTGSTSPESDSSNKTHTEISVETPEDVIDKALSEIPSFNNHIKSVDVDYNIDSSLDADTLLDEEHKNEATIHQDTSIITNHISQPASWSPWSKWFKVSDIFKVRIRSCQVEGQEVSEKACGGGVLVQKKLCSDISKNKCGDIINITTSPKASCVDNGLKTNFIKDTKETKRQEPVPVFKRKENALDYCEFSLYDAHRRKYVFVRWNTSQLIARSKVKRWCDKSSGQYIVMSSPDDQCRRYYKDLCKVSQRCRTKKPMKERGDFAEGCWRELVFGDRLPIGLSNKQTIVYFICQRFAAESEYGRLFGYKDTHFGTLYDTHIRAPVLALNKITVLGDQTWPDTDYLIEHGLVESENSMLWFFKKPKKGIMTLADLDRCRDDQSCDVGLRQILPHDYQDPPEMNYRPTHLLWPELMPPDPAPRLATFTMTNMAPLHKDLYSEWHEAVKRVRKFAVEECGVPLVLDDRFKHLSEYTSHRMNKSALYVAAGVIPSQFPVEEVGHDVNVPFMFWLSGCCVQHHQLLQQSSSSNNLNLTSEQSVESNTNITSFSVYIRNTPDSHVIAAPVLQLEMLLQDSYKTLPTDPDVTLFPGQDSQCSLLKNDVSTWFL